MTADSTIDLVTAEALVEARARDTVGHHYGTRPRHTRARTSGCRDDCIPCGIAKLARAVLALDDARGVDRDPMAVWVVEHLEGR